MKLLISNFILVISALVLTAAQPLHQLIDRHIAATWNKQNIIPAQPADDAEFLRRVFLDLTGLIPPPDVARKFFDDTSHRKRTQLIDQLLASHQHTLHMARIFDVMLTERRVSTIKSYDVKADRWRDYLIDSFAANKPWDQLTRELLGSDGADIKTGPAAKFTLVRNTEPHLLTRDIGRLFLGIDLQCARCHDDPRFDDYLQADYYGIHAFVNRLRHFYNDKTRDNFVEEHISGDDDYTDVFNSKKDKAQPRLPGGKAIPDLKVERGKQYIQKRTKEQYYIPSYSRRAQLAKYLPNRTTRNFSRNAANRLWALMMHRGLVHPPDLHHAKNPPSHPELMTLLAQRLEAMNYDIKAFLREIVLSQAYQLSSRLSNGNPPSEAFAVRPLRGLSPEQLALNLMAATGHVHRHFGNQPKPLAELRKTFATLDRNTLTFSKHFAGLPGNPDGPFAPSVGQALFLLNSDSLRNLLKKDGALLIGRLAKLKASNEIANELYLSTLTRPPTEMEKSEVAKHLKNQKGDGRIAALQELAWARLISAEFRLNH